MSLVEYEAAEGVAHLRLNRPGSANAFDLRTARAFREAVDRAGDEPEVRAVMVSGAGARFCAGGDVASFAAAADRPAYLHRLAGELDEAFRALGALPKPVVAAVHGAVAGAGLGLLLTADVAIAAPGTTFVFAYPQIGLTPDCGVSWMLPRAVGSQRALTLALTGRTLEATTAREWGLVAAVEDDPLQAATVLARSWADGPAGALGRTRLLLRAAWDVDRAAAGTGEAAQIAEAVRGEEAQELIRAFVDRTR